MYKHRCGAVVETIAAAFVHLVDCPLEEPPARRASDGEPLIGARPRSQRVDRDLDTRYRQL